MGRREKDMDGSMHGSREIEHEIEPPPWGVESGERDVCGAFGGVVGTCGLSMRAAPAARHTVVHT